MCARGWFGLVASLILPLSASLAAEHIAVKQCLALDRVGQMGRSPVHEDALEAQIVDGRWHPPVSGETVAGAGRGGAGRSWQLIQADADGWLKGSAMRGDYAYVPVYRERAGVLLLEAAGHSMVYVNGEPRAGDVYETGYVHLPVQLDAGTNDFLFVSGRGRLKVSLVEPRAQVMLDVADPTLPDLVGGEKLSTWGAVVVINSTGIPQTNLFLRARVDAQHEVETKLPRIPALGVRKVPFQIHARAAAGNPSQPLHLRLWDKSSGYRRLADEARLDLRVRRPDQTQKRTFVSEIDGSVQYWALNPASVEHGDTARAALFLSLHGAGVEAIGQADAYAPKRWGNLAAATNRRPYGFDWEMWGRLDALEVLNQAITQFHPDPQRVYLTGHSMGGHGTWQLGVLFPDRFAAIGPSAGWISFTSYGGGVRQTNPSPVIELLQRAAAAEDTLALATNLVETAVYILHGDADDNVPVTEARRMREHLAQFHDDFQYHEQPGAGHWWDASDEPGADCVDWAPMFDFFAHHVRRTEASTREIRFSTVNPGVSARCQWLEIEQQQKSMRMTTVKIRWDPGKRRFVGTTENAASIALSLQQVKPGPPLRIELDGQVLDSLAWPKTPRLLLDRLDGRWGVASGELSAAKNPRRYGPFKEAFNHRVEFVYGTAGRPEENAWSLAKARFDAEQFYYRGNGAIEVLSDVEFDDHADPDRSVVLYGNADINRAWSRLLVDSPVQVRRGEIRIGSRVLSGEDQACLFLRPRSGSQVACVGVVAGTGLPGLRLTERLPYFMSGVNYPDCTVLGTEMLSQGAQGVRAAGFFGPDWSVERGEFAFREP